MGNYIKRLFSAVFGIGSLLFLFPIFASDLGIGSRVFSGVIFCVAMLFSLGLWGATLDAVDTDTATNKTTSVTGAAGAETDQERVKRLKKSNRFFAYQKHLSGVPERERKARLDIALEDDAVAFYDSGTNTKTLSLPWSCLVAVETTDAEASSDEATNNAFRMAAYSSNKTSMGGAILLEGAMSLWTKTPLLIRFRLNPEDEFVSSILFDTYDNTKIAERLNAVRNQLVSTGVISTERKVAPVSGADTFLEKIERLAKLRDAGHLTDLEFEAQKQRILASS